MNTPEYNRRLCLERLSHSEFTDALREFLGLETYEAISSRKSLERNRPAILAGRRRKNEERREQAYG